jgi:hypothetical protein
MRCIVNSRRPHRPHQILHSVKASYRAPSHPPRSPSPALPLRDRDLDARKAFDEMRRHAAPRRAHVAMRLPAWPPPPHPRTPRARGRRRRCARKRRGVTSPHLTSPLSLSFSDPAAASPPLRLPAPCRPCHASPPSFRFRLPPPPCRLPHLARNLAAHLLVARPPRSLASLPVSSFFILRAGRVVVVVVGVFVCVCVCSRIKEKERKRKNGLYFCDQQLACRSLAGSHSSGSSGPSWSVAKQAIAELELESLFLGVPGHFEVRSFVEL